MGFNNILQNFSDFSRLKKDLEKTIRNNTSKKDNLYFYFLANSKTLLQSHGSVEIKKYGFEEVFKDISFRFFKDILYQTICDKEQKILKQSKPITDPYFYNKFSSFLNEWIEDKEGNLFYSNNFYSDINYLYKTNLCIKYNTKSNTISFERTIKAKPYYILLHEFSEECNDVNTTNLNAVLVDKIIEKKEKDISELLFAQSNIYNEFLTQDIFHYIASEITALHAQKFIINELSKIKIKHITRGKSSLIDEIDKNPEEYKSSYLKDDDEQKVYIEYCPDFYNSSFSTDWNNWTSKQGFDAVKSQNNMEYVLIKVQPNFSTVFSGDIGNYYLHFYNEHKLIIINQDDKTIADINKKMPSEVLFKEILELISHDFSVQVNLKEEFLSLYHNEIEKFNNLFMHISPDIVINPKVIDNDTMLKIFKNRYPVIFSVNDTVIYEDCIPAKVVNKEIVAIIENMFIQHNLLLSEKNLLKTKKRI